MLDRGESSENDLLDLVLNDLDFDLFFKDFFLFPEEFELSLILNLFIDGSSILSISFHFPNSLDDTKVAAEPVEFALPVLPRR